MKRKGRAGRIAKSKTLQMEKKLQDEKYAAEIKRIEAERKAEKERIVAAKKMERERIEAEKKAEKERIEAEIKTKKEGIEVAKRAEVMFLGNGGGGMFKAKTIQTAKTVQEARYAAELKRMEAARKAEIRRIDATNKAEMRRIETARKAEIRRIEAEKKAEIKRIDSEKKAEMKRIAALKKAEHERIAAAIKAEKERIEAERRVEKERIAAAKKAERERINKEKEARMSMLVEPNLILLNRMPINQPRAVVNYDYNQSNVQLQQPTESHQSARLEASVQQQENQCETDTVTVCKTTERFGTYERLFEAAANFADKDRQKQSFRVMCQVLYDAPERVKADLIASGLKDVLVSCIEKASPERLQFLNVSKLFLGPKLSVDLFEEVLPILKAILAHRDTENIINILKCIKSYNKRGGKFSQLILEHNIFPTIVNLILHNDTDVIALSLNLAMCYLNVRADYKQREVLINSGVLYNISNLLMNTTNNVVVKTLRFLWTIMCRRSLRSLLSFDVISSLASILWSDNDNIIYETVWVLSALVKSSNIRVCISMLHSGIVISLCHNLKKASNDETVRLILVIFQKMLRRYPIEDNPVRDQIIKYGAHDKIHELSTSTHFEIYYIANRIYLLYFTPRPN